MPLGESTEKKIKFTAEESITPFMKKLLNDQKNLYAEFSKNAKSQTDNQKEQLKLIENQIKALERKSRLEKEIMRDQVRALREFGGEKEQIKADQLENQLRDRRYSDKNAILGLKDRLQDDRDGLPKQPSASSSMFTGTLMAGIVKDILHSLGRTVGAKTEFDLITPFASSSGAAFGAGVGALTGWLSPGAPAAITQAGKELGGFVGAGQTRHLMAREEATAGSARVRGLVGGAFASDLSRFGLDRGAGSQLEESIVRAIQKGTTAEQVRNIAAISKAYTIDSNSITQYLSTGRMGSYANENNLLQLRKALNLNGAQFGSAIQNVSGLMSLMGQTTLAPSSRDALNKTFENNNIGGPFSSGDPRSMGFLSTIHNNLVSPQSPFAQALSYQVLREQNPNASLLDIMKSRQAGGNAYEGGILRKMGSLTGDSDLNTLMYSSIFGTGNVAVDEKRLANRNQIGFNWSMFNNKDMTEGQKQQLYGQASSMTTTLQQSTAEVTNAFVIGFTEGIGKLAENFTDMMGKAIEDFAKDKFSPFLKVLEEEKAKEPNVRGRR
jgi:hypothetical protein